MRLQITASAAIAATLLLAPAADARARGPHITWVKCMRACTDKRTVAPGGAVKLAGRRLPRASRVIFPVRLANGRRTGGRLQPKSASLTPILGGAAPHRPPP